MAETKYFQLNGPSEVKINANGDLEVYFYDKSNTHIINPGKPFVFDIKTGNGRLRFNSSVLLAELTEQGYADYKDVVTQLTLGIDWDAADKPNAATMILMNPIKHPPGN